MAKFELKLPKMGESVAEATITAWLKEVGDTIEADEPVLEPESDGKYVKIVITDQGVGIPGQFLPNIYDPYFSTKEMGTGLGLSICKKIVEEHGGFIRAKNGTGLTISMFFPYQNGDLLHYKPCWEHMQCKMDVNHDESCPAYPYFGRICWTVAGTLCAGKIQGTYAQKIHDCSKCGYYRQVQSSQ